MKRRAGLGKRIVAVASLLAACGLLVAGQDACILAASSGELPRIPEGRPTVWHASVVPSTSLVLTRWPREFIVPVELADPTSTVVFASFVDFNPATGEGLDAVRRSLFEAANTQGRIRTLTVPITEPADLDQCHVIEVIVALRLKAETEPKNAHTPEEPGGDVATWFYNPNGDLGGCPALDAGIDAPIDADAGAGEGGPQ